MKKLLAIFISLTIIISTCTCVFATEADDIQSVLITVKSRVPETENYGKFESRTYTSENGKVYSFSWSDEETGKTLEINCNDKGIITYYYADDGFYSEDKVYKGDLNLAQKYILQLNPSLEGKIKIEDDPDGSPAFSSEHSYNIKVMHNGIEINGVQGYLSINTNDLSINTFNLHSYKDFEYPEGEFISKEAAQKAFNEKLGLKLVYKTKYDYKTATVYPAYELKEGGNKYINAITGDVFNNEINFDCTAGSMALNSQEKAADSLKNECIQFSSAELSNISDVAGIIPINTLEKKLRANKSFKIANTLSLSNYNLYKDYLTERYIYRISFSNKSGTYQSVNLQCDALTGEIFFYNRYFDTDKKESISEENANKLATNFAKTLAGEKFTNFKLENEQNGTATYTRYVNGIPYPDNQIYASVSKIDGSLSHYSIECNELEFPSINNALSPEECAAKMFEYTPYEIKYFPVFGENGEYTNKTVAAFYLDSYISINPFTGEPNNNEKANVAYEYTDISGHYAEEQIKEMLKYGISYEGTEYEPDKEITQKEFTAMLVKLFNYTDVMPLGAKYDYESCIRIAKRNGYITQDEFNKDAPTSRILAAKCMIRAMGIEKYAKLPDIYNHVFNDVNDNQGYTALLKGLKIIKGDENGNYNPNGNLTRADTAILLYNYINNK